MSVHVYVGTDHGGYEIKEELMPWLHTLQAEQVLASVTDVGAEEFDPVDNYPEFGHAVAEEVHQSQATPEVDPPVRGILLCRTGGGMAIVANRYPGVRAVVCRSVDDVRHARGHNNANVLVLEGDHVTVALAKPMIEAFLTTPFDAGRHVRRVQQIERT